MQTFKGKINFRVFETHPRFYETRAWIIRRDFPELYKKFRAEWQGKDIRSTANMIAFVEQFRRLWIDCFGDAEGFENILYYRGGFLRVNVTAF